MTESSGTLIEKNIDQEVYFKSYPLSHKNYDEVKIVPLDIILSSSDVSFKFIIDVNKTNLKLSEHTLCRNISELEWILNYIEKYLPSKITSPHLSSIPDSIFLKLFEKCVYRYDQKTSISLHFQNSMLNSVCMAYVFLFYSALSNILEQDEILECPTVQLFFKDSRRLPICRKRQTDIDILKSKASSMISFLKSDSRPSNQIESVYRNSKMTQDSLKKSIFNTSLSFQYFYCMMIQSLKCTEILIQKSLPNLIETVRYYLEYRTDSISTYVFSLYPLLYSCFSKYSLPHKLMNSAKSDPETLAETADLSKRLIDSANRSNLQNIKQSLPKILDKMIINQIKIIESLEICLKTFDSLCIANVSV
ncbi:MAG: hypothetical protein MHMPM18_001205 [Marteilia pararefringens]